MDDDRTIVRKKEQRDMWINIQGEKHFIEDGDSLSLGRKSIKPDVKNDQDIVINDPERQISRGKSVIFKRVGQSVEISINGNTVVTMDKEEYENMTVKCEPPQQMMIGTIPCVLENKDESDVTIKKIHTKNEDTQETTVKRQVHVHHSQSMPPGIPRKQQVVIERKEEPDDNKEQENSFSPPLQDHHDKLQYNRTELNQKRNQNRQGVTFAPVKRDKNNHLPDSNAHNFFSENRFLFTSVSVLFLAICFALMVWPGFSFFKRSLFQVNKNKTCYEDTTIFDSKPLHKTNETYQADAFQMYIQKAKQLIEQHKPYKAEEFLLKIPASSQYYDEAERLLNEIDQQLFK